MRRYTTTTLTLLAVALLMGLGLGMGTGGASQGAGSPMQIEVLLPRAFEPLQAPAHVLRDAFGIPHIFAANAHDLYLLTGYVQAQDRLFQMDATRRLASGTLAELLGQDALASDVQLRTLGLRRAAELSEAALSEEARAELEAYAAGVNLFIEQAQASGRLPPEYGALEITRVAPWTAVDSLVIGKAIIFQLSFDLDVANTLTLSAYTQALGGGGPALFYEDLFRSAPADPATIVPDAEGRSASLLAANMISVPALSPETLRLAREYYDRVKEIPFLQAPLRRADASLSSNWVLISGRHSATGHPLLASDPHLALSSPAVWYELDQKVLGEGGFSVTGVTFPGIPYVILGHNGRISWAATVNPLDVTDTFSEQIVPGEGGQLFSLFKGELEPLQVIPETFRVNVIGDGVADSIAPVPPQQGVPAATLVVPRHGPVIHFDSQTGAALSVQYTGFYATQELETFRIWNRARDLDDFKEGLKYFDSGSQDWGYADVDGNIAYFASAELPLREDLDQGFVDQNIPPFLIRDGTGGLQHQWIPQEDRPAHQAIPFAVLPFEEMPQTVNPAEGWIVSANNDPLGTTLDNDPLNQRRPNGGILYLNREYALGFRAGRLTELVRGAVAGGGKISLEDLMRFQGDVVALEAERLTPHLLEALEAIGTEAALAPFRQDPRLGAVADLLRDWDFSMPTGLPEGFDFDDDATALNEPTEAEIRRSAAATVFNVWVSRLLKNTIDGVLNAISPQLPKPGDAQAIKALIHLLETFDERGGVGLSGLPFFNVPDAPGLPAAVRRDIVLLRSLQDALDLLAGDAFASAFGHSTNLLDYRWGKLHRVVFKSLVPPFSVPPLGVSDPRYAQGFPADGGYAVVDRSDFDLRGADADAFTFSDHSGPSRRFVAELDPEGIRAFNAIPGGQSGVPGAPHFADQLLLWLANDYHPLYFSESEILTWAESWQDFYPR